MKLFILSIIKFYLFFLRHFKLLIEEFVLCIDQGLIVSLIELIKSDKVLY